MENTTVQDYIVQDITCTKYNIHLKSFTTHGCKSTWKNFKRSFNIISMSIKCKYSSIFRLMRKDPTGTTPQTHAQGLPATFSSTVNILIHSMT